MNARGRTLLATVLLFAGVASAVQPEAAPTAAPGGTAPMHKLALLVAVQGYGRFGKEWQNLDGTINDIALMRDVLTKRFGFARADVAMVCDDPKTCRTMPTRKGIAAAFAALTNRAQSGDLVYIHYSGHGSTVPDANGDEPGPDGRDSTLVPIDARDTESMEILDDEVRIWLSRLGERTDDVVFVSDSCHSGTITRGAKSAKTRGAPSIDRRDYSWSRQLPGADAAPPPQHLVRVSAARDTQRAYEYQAPNGKSYGRLTWFWAKALRAAAPGQSYDAVYRSVSAMMPPREQQPVIEGAGDRELFQARFAPLPRQVAAVRVDEKQVEFDDGLLSGMTVGSVFERVGAGNGPRQATLTLRLTAVDAYSARGVIQGDGNAKAGDLFEETVHVYAMPRLRVAVRADDRQDAPVKQALQEAIASIGAAIHIVPQGQSADLILSLAHPHGAADARLECSILDDAEQLYAPNLRIPIERGDASTGRLVPDGIAAIRRDVERIVRNRSILDAADQGLGALADQVTVDTVRLTDAADDDGDADVVEIPFSGPFSAKPKRQRITPLTTESGAVELQNGDVIAFRLTNRSNRVRYFYLINIGPDGTAQVIFPHQGFEDNARLPADSGPQLIRDAAVQVDGPRDTYIWFVTETPTNVWALAGQGFANTETPTNVSALPGQGFANGSRGQMPRGGNVLAELLRQAGSMTRGIPATGTAEGEFAARKVVVHVTPARGA